jgi:KDO2-lipid IV(A) lauroyltransferase
VKKFRNVLESAIVRSATWFLPRLPRRLLLVLSDAVGLLAYTLDHRGRSAAHENLRAAFARERITPEQVRRIARASYRNFARTFFDLFCSLKMTREQCAERVNIRWEDPRSEDIARERGCLWVTAHFGNFEMVSLAMGFRGFSWGVVAQDFKNPVITEIFTKLREGSGHHIIVREGAMVRVMKELKRGGHIGLLSDLTIPPNKTATVIDCFGLKTCVTTLHTNLAVRTGVPIVQGVCLSLPDGSYRVMVRRHLEAADYKSSRDMAQDVWNWFEQRIREHPEAWMWMYKHWRYLPGLERDSRYPAYANPHKPFREMLAAVDEW